MNLSGLDSLNASLVVPSLQRAAKARGVTVVCTIRQPSKEVFETSDKLLLLRNGGVVVYNGDISGISSYMASISGNDTYELKPGTNPGDHASDIFCGPGEESVDWGSYANSLLWHPVPMRSPMNVLASTVALEALMSKSINVVSSGVSWIDKCWLIGEHRRTWRFAFGGHCLPAFS
jgi:ABC-type multidrug transport system ATPase subunit